MPKPPPHEKDSVYLHWRCHQAPDDPLYINFIREYFTDYIVAYETHSNRPHFHAVIRHKGCPKNPFTTLIHTRFPKLEGQGDFMVKNCAPTEEDEKNLKAYVCKGDSVDKEPVILATSYSTEQIKYFHDYYYAKNKITTYFSQTVADTPEALHTFIKTKKPKAYTWTEKTYNYLYEGTYGPEPFFPDWDYSNSAHKDLMMDIVLKKLGEKGKGFLVPQLVSICNGFFNGLGARNFHDDIKHRARQFQDEQRGHF